jgi:hypothetical protein
MNWTRLAGPLTWPAGPDRRSHALLPTPLPGPTVGDGPTVEVLATALDGQNFGRIFSMTLGVPDFGIRHADVEPRLDLGPEGAFDDSGVVPSCVLRVDDTLVLYYLGFQRAERVPYMIFTGAATSTDAGRTWKKVQATPILDRTAAEPFSRGAPFVMRDGDRFVCYYWSCWGWTHDGGKIHYNNHIHRLTSTDPLRWDGPSEVVLRCDPGPEFSVGRPCILVIDGVYHLWLSTRSLERPYRLGYAISRDGVHWQRHDALVGLWPSASGWDADMVCYASIVQHGDRVFMLYNGNGHGRTGFGVAELDGGVDTLRRTADRLLNVPGLP